MKKIILTLILIIVFSVVLTADIYIKSVKDTAPFELMGKKKPGETEIEEVWMSKTVLASDTRAMRTVIDYNKKRIYLIIKSEKKCVEVPLYFSPDQLEKFFPPRVAAIIRSISISNVRAGVDRKKERIGNWDCFKTNLQMDISIPALGMMLNFKITTWLTESAPFNYLEYKRGMVDFFEGFFTNFIKLDEKTRAEFKKIDNVKGFEVGSDVEFTFFGSVMKSNKRVIDVKKTDPPAGIYSIPSGYQKVDFLTILGMNRK